VVISISFLLFHKIGCRSRKARGQWFLSSLFRRFFRQTFLDNLLNTAHVDQVKSKRTIAGFFHPLFPVPVGEPDELLGLPELGPGEGPREEEFGKMSCGRADLFGPVDIVGAAPHGIGGLLLWIISKVCGPLPLRNRRMGLDEAALVIDAE
jgi:hypothetical protein